MSDPTQTPEWLVRMREEWRAEDERAAAEEAAKAAPSCCRSFERYGHHDHYCSQNHSRSAGS